MQSMRKAFALAVCFCAASAFAATTGEWIGGASGDWGNPDNWQGGVPSTTAYIRPSAAGEAIEITVDGDYSPSKIVFGSSGTHYGENRPTIRLKGSGTITAPNAYTEFFHDIHVVFDGVTLNASYISFSGSSNDVEFVGGTKVNTPSAVLCPGIANRFAISDAEVIMKEFPVGTNSVLEVTGRMLKTTARAIALSEGAKVVFTGGKIYQSSGSAPLLPKGSGELYLSSSTALDLPAGVGTCYEINGSVVATNSSKGATIANNTNGQIAYGGRGSLYADKLEVPAQKLMEIDLSNLAIGAALHTRTAARTTKLLSYGPLTLGAYGDWTFARQGQFIMDGDLTVDTLDCFDGTVTHTIPLRNFFPYGGSSLKLNGGGSVTLGMDDAQHLLRFVVLKDGTDLSFYTDSGSAAFPRLSCFNFSADSGSTISVTAGTAFLDVSEVPSFAAGSAISATLPASPVAGTRYPILVADPSTDVGGISVTDASGTAGWSIARSLGCIYYTDGMEAAKTTAYEWTGAASANINTPDNWNGEAVPASAYDTVAVFSGDTNCDIENDMAADSIWSSMKFTSGGPWRVSGNRMILRGGNASVNAPLRNSCSLPVTVDCDIRQDWSTYGDFYAIADSNSYVRLNGNVSLSRKFFASGDIRIGGNLACPGVNLSRTWGTAPRTRLTILRGGSVTASNQGDDIAIIQADASICVEPGGTLTIAGGTKYGITATGLRHQVNGVFDCRVPFMTTKDTYLEGTGVVRIASSVSSTANASVWLRGGVKVCPASWATVTAGNEDHALRLAVETRATLLATNDWRYGVADGVEATVAVADRALLVTSPLSVLTVDTQDPESGTGHTVTLADPVIGYGKLVKRGAGTLVLTSDANAVTGGVSVAEGALAWTADQLTPSLDVEPGTSLLFGWNGSEASVLTVESDLDLTGVNVRPVAGSPVFIGHNTVIAAMNGAKITGTPILPDGYSYSIDGEGTVLRVHRSRGLSIIIR